MVSVAALSPTLTPTSAHLHHRCQFDIVEIDSNRDAWSNIVKTVRSWLIRAMDTDDQMLGAWFFSGGDWKGSPSPRTRISTACEEGRGSPRTPQFWSCRFEHQCREVPFRQWRTDIGITALDDRFRFSIATCCWIVPGYIGQEPPNPVPTAPGVIGSLFRGRSWACFAGSERLYTTPTVVRNGSGQMLSERLEDANRQCPIVLVSCAEVDGDPVVDPVRLANALSGSARVYVAEAPDVEREWEYILPRGFRCRNGMVRVYQPGLCLENERDAARHRYFSEDQIRELGDAAVREMIVRGIVRRANATGFRDVTTIEDVHSKRREARLLELKLQADDKSKDEWIALLEPENARLHNHIAELQIQLETALGRTEDLADQTADLSDQVSSLTYRNQELAASIAERSEETKLLELQIQSLAMLKQLPRSVREVAVLVQSLHPSRICLTERGLASTEDRSEACVSIAWECLWAMATELHPMFFSDSTRQADLERKYQDTTGFELSMTEGRNTKRDKKLMNLRKDIYGGETVDITPHVKVGNREPRLLRVHFYPDRARKLIVIGHCGGHLDNFSTRNQ